MMSRLPGGIFTITGWSSAASRVVKQMNLSALPPWRDIIRRDRYEPFRDAVVAFLKENV